MQATEHPSPTAYFELFYDDAMINMILIREETNRYAAEQMNKALYATNKEIRCLICILLISGYVSVNRRKMQWENAADVYHKLVANAMRHDRFDDIFSCLHFSNNNQLDQQDKYAKIRPLVTKLNKLFLQHAPNKKCHSFDESMCEYFGKHGCKQMIRGKPIRFGFKLFVGALASGYCFNIRRGESSECV